MKNPNSSLDELSEKIEKMVTEHVAALRAAAQAAVARAFAATASSEARQQRDPKRTPAVQLLTGARNRGYTVKFTGEMRARGR